MSVFRTSRTLRLRHVATVAAVAAATTGVTALAAGSAHAATQPTQICKAAAGNPIFPLNPGGAYIQINQSYDPISITPYRDKPVSGNVDLTAVNGPVLVLPGYDQAVRFDWENLTTHKTGTATATTAVGGEGGAAYVSHVVTGPGQVRVTAHVSNTGNAALGSSGLRQYGSCVGKPFTVI